MNTQPTPAPTPRTDKQTYGGAWEVVVPADFARTLERELTEARATLLAREGELDSMSAALAAKDAEIAELSESLSAEKNYHGQAQAAAYEQNEIANQLSKELDDLKNAGGPPFIRSEAIRNLRDQVCGLKARAEKAEAELEAERCETAEMAPHYAAIEAERDQLRAEVEALRSDRKVWMDARDQHMQEADQLRARVADLEQDKARLLSALERWMREWSLCYQEQSEVGHSEMNVTAGLVCDTRAAIDAARKAQP